MSNKTLLFLINRAIQWHLDDLQTKYAFAEAIANFNDPPKPPKQLKIAGLQQAMDLLNETGKYRLEWAIAVINRRMELQNAI